MEQDAMLQQFVDGVVADRFTEYEVVAFAPNWDSDYHCPAHDGRHLVVEGRVVLEIDGRHAEYGKGDTYEIPANTRHREVFGPAGCKLCIARRKQGEPPLAPGAGAGAR